MRGKMVIKTGRLRNAFMFSCCYRLEETMIGRGDENVFYCQTIIAKKQYILFLIVQGWIVTQSQVGRSPSF